jgi:hypothetical protein
MDPIDRQVAIDALKNNRMLPLGDHPAYNRAMRDSENVIRNLPSAQPDYQEVLGWLLAYHTKSFDLHGRYLPHEVISWLINDFTKEFIAERRQDV